MIDLIDATGEHGAGVDSSMTALMSEAGRLLNDDDDDMRILFARKGDAQWSCRREIERVISEMAGAATHTDSDVKVIRTCE